MRKLILSILLIALALSLITNVYLLTSYQSRNEVYDSDKEWITKAIQVRAARQHASPQAVARLSRACVVHFRDDVCVGLSPARGVLGGDNVVCLARSSGQVTREENFGE